MLKRKLLVTTIMALLIPLAGLSARANSMTDDGIHLHTAHCADINAYDDSTTPITFQDAKTNQATWVAWLILSGEKSVTPGAVNVARRFIVTECRLYPADKVDVLLSNLILTAKKIDGH